MNIFSFASAMFSIPNPFCTCLEKPIRLSLKPSTVISFARFIVPSVVTGSGFISDIDSNLDLFRLLLIFHNFSNLLYLTCGWF